MITGGVPNQSIAPVADSTQNNTSMDVIGNKTDAGYSSPSTTKSVVAYVKGALNNLLSPTVDSASGSAATQVIGAKGDTGVSSVGATKSLVAYVKGIISRLVEIQQNAHLVRVSSTVSTYADVVNITDKGILKGIFQSISTSGIGGSGAISVTIDGGTAVEINPFSFVHKETSEAEAFGSLPCDLPFYVSLRVQHKATAGSTTVNTAVSYTTD